MRGDKELLEVMHGRWLKRLGTDDERVWVWKEKKGAILHRMLESKAHKILTHALFIRTSFIKYIIDTVLSPQANLERVLKALLLL